MLFKYIFFLFVGFAIISCKTIGPNFNNEVFKNEYQQVLYMLLDKDSIWHYSSEYENMGGMKIRVSGDKIYEGDQYIPERDIWIIQKGQIVSQPPYKFVFLPLSKKESKKFFEKIKENN